MSEESLVFSGEDVEEAVAVGLAALGLARDQVRVEVLDEGSRGILGIGARPASVRLIPVAPPTPTATEAAAAAGVETAEAAGAEELAESARRVLKELLERMEFPAAEVHLRWAEPAAGEEQPLILDVRGPGVEVLIGPKGETLAALQRIVRLIVGRYLAHEANLIVDVDGFKQRQERTLRRLAERMAEKAVRDGRAVALEPMPPYERRIVHLALRERADVRTESVGEGRRRRVTIIPQSQRERG